MRTLEHRHSRPHKPTTSSLVRYNTEEDGMLIDTDLIQSPERSIGDQGTQRMLQPDEEFDLELDAMPTLRFAHDFSQIPIFRLPAGVIQTKLTVNKRGDEYEQEADRIAERVMRNPEPQPRRSCSCGGGCSMCQL